MGANDSGANQIVLPFGGTEPRLSTNPLAAAFPRSERPNFVLDFATSIASQGTMLMRKRQHLGVPDGWASDGHLNPLGGHKGYGLGLMAEILAGILSRAGFVGSESRYEYQGMFLVVVDIDRFAERESFARQVEELFAYVKTSSLKNLNSDIVIPGELSERTRIERLRNRCPARYNYRAGTQGACQCSGTHLSHDSVRSFIAARSPLDRSATPPK